MDLHLLRQLRGVSSFSLSFFFSICRDDLVIGAGSNAGALLVDGLGDGVLLEAPDKDFDFLRNTSFNLLQGCRMRNTKTVKIFFFSKEKDPTPEDNSLHHTISLYA